MGLATVGTSHGNETSHGAAVGRGGGRERDTAGGEEIIFVYLSGRTGHEAQEGKNVTMGRKGH